MSSSKTWLLQQIGKLTIKVKKEAGLAIYLNQKISYSSRILNIFNSLRFKIRNHMYLTITTREAEKNLHIKTQTNKDKALASNIII